MNPDASGTNAAPSAGPDSPAPDESARLATAADIDPIVRLAADLRAQMATERGGPLWIAHDALAPMTAELVEARLAAADVATIVGTLDGHVLAYGLAHTEPVPTAGVPGLLGVIDELYVAEPARAVGLGETLLGALVAWCTDSGVTLGIDATALPGDRQAKNFFESAGFKARRLVMHQSTR